LPFSPAMVCDSVPRCRVQVARQHCAVARSCTHQLPIGRDTTSSHPTGRILKYASSRNHATAQAAGQAASPGNSGKLRRGETRLPEGRFLPGPFNRALSFADLFRLFGSASHYTAAHVVCGSSSTGRPFTYYGNGLPNILSRRCSSTFSITEADPHCSRHSGSATSFRRRWGRMVLRPQVAQADKWRATLARCPNQSCPAL
jgi:hypothetical protein